jgi:hypothetical protein
MNVDIKPNIVETTPRFLTHDDIKNLSQDKR